MTTEQIATPAQIRAAATRAAEAFTFGRTRNAGCPFLASHRDGDCQKCRQMAEHDAEIARQWHEAQAVKA
jgi:hypothetical protein